MNTKKITVALIVIVTLISSIPSTGKDSDVIEEVSTFDTGIGCWDVQYFNNLLYVTDFFTGLHILNVSDLKNPFEIANYRVGNGGTHKFIIDDQKAYLPDWSDVLEIVSISDPNGPKLLGSYMGNGQSYDIALHDSIAFIAYEEQGLLILNISDPCKPSKISMLSCGEITHVIYHKGYVFATEIDTGLHLIEVKDPKNPLLVKTFPKYNGIGCIVNNIAYTSSTKNAGAILNISNIEEPTELGKLPNINYICQIKVINKIAFIAAYEQGILIANVTDNTYPYFIGQYSSENPSTAVEVAENVVYGTFKNLGLRIFQINLVNRTSIHVSSTEINFFLILVTMFSISSLKFLTRKM